MIKLTIALIVLIGAGIAWLRMQWAVGQNKKESDRLINGLKDGSFTVDSFDESLGFVIQSKALPEGMDKATFFNKLPALTNTRMKNRFPVQYATTDQHSKAIVFGNGGVKDTLSASSGKQVEVTYPCWVSVAAVPSSEEIIFKSTMPDGKDHQYLLQDFANAIYEHGTR